MEPIKTPTSIKIISIIFFIIYPIMYFKPLLEVYHHYFSKLDIPLAIQIIIIVLIPLSLFILLGIKLRKGKNYARIIIIVLSLIYPFLVLPSLQSPYKFLLYYALISLPFFIIAIYLLFSKNIKIFFNNKGKMATKKVIFLVLIIALPILIFFPIYDGYRICGTFEGCWNTNANLIEYFKYINR